MSFTGRIVRGPMAADVLEEQFTRIYNLAARDKRLSRRARGLLVEILSHRDGFGISMAALLANGPEGRDALTAALKELEVFGYLHRARERNELGQLGDTRFMITDMPEGLLIGVAAPWEAPTEPVRKTRRSEPKSENPHQVEQPQTRRSEPKSDFPAQAEPAQAQPTHKKNNPSEDHLSPARRAESQPSQERESSAAPQEQSAEGDAQSFQEQAETVVVAYGNALGRPVVNGTAAGLRVQALELLVAGYPAQWLEDRARELAANGWLDLSKHVARSTVPVPRAAGAGSEPQVGITASMAARLARAEEL